MIKSRPLRYFVELICFLLMLSGASNLIFTIIGLVGAISGGAQRLNYAFVAGGIFGYLLLIIIGYELFMYATKPDAEISKKSKLPKPI